MHHIQLQILNKLLYADRLPYAAMRPSGVESNHFAYHLDQLIRAKLVEKVDKQYRLTSEGKRYVDKLSSDRMKLRPQPSIDTAIDLATPDGKVLLFQNYYHPYFHLAGFPAGKLHLDETVEEAARRELAEKTGITGIELVHRGIVYIDAWRNEERISKKLYHVFHGEVATEMPTVTPPQRGRAYWADYMTLDLAQLMPGYLKIKSLLAASPDFFFAEYTETV